MRNEGARDAERAGEERLGPARVLHAEALEDTNARESYGGERARRVRRMFGDIAHAYDLNNHLLSLNTDRRWRARAVRMGLEGREATTRTVLDCCTGTGDLALAFAARLCGDASVIGADFTPEMVQHGAKKNSGSARVDYLVADAMNLPFAGDTFDLVTVAFGIRNVAELARGLEEMARVVRSGGRVLVLEFSPLRNRAMRWTYNVYFTRVLPWIGGLISRRRDAYRYLAESVKTFPDCEELKSAMEAAGLENVRYRRLTFGIAAIHVGEKPEK